MTQYLSRKQNKPEDPQGINNKKERNKVIKETLKASAIRSDKESYFSRKGVGKSEAQRMFDRMSFGISTIFNKYQIVYF